MDEKSEAIGKIKKQKLEDYDLLKKIEKIFIQRRGYAFRMPPPGSKVVSLMSGGLDTTVATAMLMEKYKLQVYAVHFNRKLKHSKKVLIATKYFFKYFKKRYPTLFREPKVLKFSYPSKTIYGQIHLNSGKIFINKRINHRRGVPFEQSAYIHNVVNYIYTLGKKEQKEIRTIFTASLKENVDAFVFESLTSFRSLMLGVCTMLNDFSWQCTSLPLEKELGFYLSKADLIRIGDDLDLPLEKTWTCSNNFKYQCGVCDVCGGRRKGFKEAGVVDKTIYDIEKRDFFSKLKRRSKLFRILLESFC